MVLAKWLGEAIWLAATQTGLRPRRVEAIGRRREYIKALFRDGGGFFIDKGFLTCIIELERQYCNDNVNMVRTIESKRDSLIELCRRFAVKRLEIFGSAASGQFDPSNSDIDFLVEFEIATPGEHAARYFGLLAALQDLFSLDIDLVEMKAVKNPYFKKNIESSRMPIYG